MTEGGHVQSDLVLPAVVYLHLDEAEPLRVVVAVALALSSGLAAASAVWPDEVAENPPAGHGLAPLHVARAQRLVRAAQRQRPREGTGRGCDAAVAEAEVLLDQRLLANLLANVLRRVLVRGNDHNARRALVEAVARRRRRGVQRLPDVADQVALVALPVGSRARRPAGGLEHDHEASLDEVHQDLRPRARLRHGDAAVALPESLAAHECLRVRVVHDRPHERLPRVFQQAHRV
mmetsp:Transcript_44136/g.116784  ORF Transcript_44136/g.116784 Transcript_44136/m.116784 type:complete len:234 (-) Transcript_44136:263-964(-)